MTQAVYSILTGVVIAVLAPIVTGYLQRYKNPLKESLDNYKKAVEEYHEEMKDFKECQELLCSNMLAVMLALKSGKVNGEISKAIDDFNKYMIKK